MRGRYWWHDNGDDHVQRSRLLDRALPPPYQIGERLLLRDVHLKRYDAIVEFRAVEVEQELPELGLFAHPQGVTSR